MTTEQLFLKASADKLTQLVERIEVCFGKLSSEQIWARGHDNENALGNLALHLEGNVRQWILTGLTGSAGARDRDAEFAARRGPDGAELIAKLKATVAQATSVVSSLTDDALRKMYPIQGYQVSGVEVVLHVVEHFSYHTGQIIFATKHVTGEDLGFYRHLASRSGGSQSATPMNSPRP